MKNILNNISEEEKNAIREQHTGGMKVNTEKFRQLVETKQGDVKEYLSEQTKPLPDLFRVGDKLQVDWVNDKYPCQIFLTVKRPIDQHNMECVVTKVDGPIVDLKPGTTVKVTVKNGRYNLNFEENSQNIEGPVKDKYLGIKKI